MKPPPDEDGHYESASQEALVQLIRRLHDELDELKLRREREPAGRELTTWIDELHGEINRARSRLRALDRASDSDY